MDVCAHSCVCARAHVCVCVCGVCVERGLGGRDRHTKRNYMEYVDDS